MDVRLIAIILSSSILLGCEQQPSGFDLVCHYFNELENDDGLSQMSGAERFNFIEQRIKASLPESDYAYLTWDALVLSPEERYSLFTQAATEVTKQPWSCESMDRLSSSVIYNSGKPTNKLPDGVVRMRDADWD
ncbi:Uncharacterised protein [BD1-7 clade bacterium]|uniref:Uncharacterized protein n=1 Tax=BD1-7 clade bacterium TaxID=2029982 RepID=A0A5S9QWU9_9GAMM|nr:Uncharacterised protein [BD1-7 clade bacterium]